ncbi:MAG TPA: hypothetical protein VMR18_02590 [Candidatus Saccharimonadales bacterium]|jgi:hypothetical protein|nr:hypothetical protein [Candidatus Saccharimonadales bacterium]
MKPDENQNPVSEPSTSIVTSSQPPTTDSAIAPITTNPTPVNTPPPTKSHKKALVALAVVLVVVLVGGGAFALYRHNHKAKPVASSSTTKTSSTTKSPATSTPVNTPAVTDTWDGTGSNSNWSNASNWSNGVPKTNYSLIFNLAANTSSGQLTSNNDLTGLTLNNLTFEGGTPNAHGVESISLSGNPISLSNGIVDTTEADVSSSIAFNVSLTTNQAFNLNGNFGFVPVSSSNLASTDLNLGSNTLTITGSNGISFNYLSGAGTLVVNPTNGDTAVIGVGQPSPNFTGSVKVEAGLFAITYGNSLGTATINVSNGATLRIVTSSSSSPLANNITLAGKGNADSSGNDFGAINLVGSNQNITLSGKITLTSNTQLGIYDATSNNPGDGSGTYTLTQAPTLNGYSLSGLTSNTKVVTQ